jgi:hypothetical protein
MTRTFFCYLRRESEWEILWRSVSEMTVGIPFGKLGASFRLRKPIREGRESVYCAQDDRALVENERGGGSAALGSTGECARRHMVRDIVAGESGPPLTRFWV